MAITDHETIASSLRAEKYYNKIKKEHPDFKVLRGNEIYLVRNGLNADNYNREIDRYFHFILIAKDLEGHKQIREISTRAWMRAYTSRGMMRVPTYYEDLEQVIGDNKGHIIASTACLGGCLATQLLRFRKSGDEALYQHIIHWLRYMQSIFGEENFYLEMQPSFNDEQIYVNNEIVKISENMDIPFIITNDAHYLKKEDIDIHEAYLRSQDGEREVKSFYTTTYLFTDEEIHEYMDKYIGKENIQKAYKNIQEIANKCEDFSLKRPLNIPKLPWKEYPMSKNVDKWMNKVPQIKKLFETGFEEDELLARAIMYKFDTDPQYRTEATYKEVDACIEDTLVSSEKNKTHWSRYYLNLQNIIDICWQSNTLVGAGRGSGVGFILLNMLDITQINPLREKTQTFRWRFLNPDRVSVMDVDCDIEGSKREAVLKNFRKFYGEDRVANVLTLGTEKSKSAILTACRGLGIDNDIANYLSSMIVADRGQLRTLSQTFYGDEENNMAPNKQFRIEMEQNYPEVWKVAQSIEGLICRTGVHAGGVIFVDEPFTESAALMRSPKGEIITQFELHDCEDVSLIKYDILSVEALDKIHNCLDLLCKDGLIEQGATLKETYENYIGIYKLERDDPKMWEMVWEHKILSLFQMEKQSGIQGIALLKPTSVDDLAVLNSTIRLMAQEKGGEMPTEKLSRFKQNPQLWLDEMAQLGLGEEAYNILEPVLNTSYGLCISQEQFMQLVQLPELGGFSLTWADSLRKSIAKKNPAAYEALTKEFFEVTAEKGCNKKLCEYVWNVLIAMSRGYGFNASHTLAYSLIALQEMNLAFLYPIIYWNCACLISDSGGQITNEDDDDIDIDDEDEDEDEEDDKKKKKNNSTNYGKIATAIGQMQSSGIIVSPPDINKSSYTFVPDAENNKIIYGIKGISKIGNEIVDNIIANRPYSDWRDFLTKVKVNKTQMVNLIKSGAFDQFGNRIEIMYEYMNLISDTKKTLNLRNLQKLIEFDLLPESLEFEKKVFNFNKYIKKNCQYKEYYALDEIAFSFYEKNFDLDLLEFEGNLGCIPQSVWDKIYKKHMVPIRQYIKDNLEELLEKFNGKLIQDNINKYALGTISKWEMDSISFYYHEHELAHLRKDLYGIDDFYKLPEDPVVDKIIPIKGKMVPLFKLNRIAGTVLDKDKSKNTVTLLTDSGVVKVKIYRPQFTKYDKQISIKGDDGKKHVIEKSWFARGNKLMIVGIRRGNEFVPKLYKSSPFNTPFFLINKIDDNGIVEGVDERLEV